MERPMAVLLAALLATGATWSKGQSLEDVLTDIHYVNMLEIRLGTLASEKGESPQLRRYGELLVRDHRVLDKAILSLAEDRDLRIVSRELDVHDRATLQLLQGAARRDFDRLFTGAMAIDHSEAIAVLGDARRRTEDRELRRQLDKALPLLRQHHSIASSVHVASLEEGP